MKKLIVALAAVAMTAGFASAQDNNAAKQCDGPRTCNAQQCGNPGDCKKELCPFDGLNLTDAQKASIKELRAKQCPAKQCDAKNSKKEAKRERKAAKLEARKQFLAELKTILTPEQYVQFLENNFVNGKKGNFGPDRKGDRRDGHRGHHRQAPDCPRSGNCPQQAK